jgi:hypothetical protein
MKTHLIWFCVCVAALLVGTQFAKKEIQVVEKPVEVIKEVPKVVERIVERRVEVPAAIPEEYVKALGFLERFRASKLVSDKESLAGVKAVSVNIRATDEVKKIVSEQELRTKFEITLRRSGVPIDEKSVYTLYYAQDGFTGPSPILVWACRTTLADMLFGFRGDGEMFAKDVPVWAKGDYGTIGITKARETLMAEAESSAEAFANDWLAMNPKK